MIDCKLQVVLGDFNSSPDTCERTKRGAQDAPAAEPVAVVGHCAQPTAERAADSYAEPYKLFHILSVALYCGSVLFRRRTVRCCAGVANLKRNSPAKACVSAVTPVTLDIAATCISSRSSGVGVAVYSGLGSGIGGGTSGHFLTPRSAGGTCKSGRPTGAQAESSKALRMMSPTNVLRGSPAASAPSRTAQAMPGDTTPKSAISSGFLGAIHAL